MASIQRPIASVLGANAVGATASYTTGSNWWLIITTSATCVAGILAVSMSLIAHHYKHRR